METMCVDARFGRLHGLDRIVTAFRLMAEAGDWKTREETPMIDRPCTATVLRYGRSGEADDVRWRSLQERVRLCQAQKITDEILVSVELEPVPVEERRLPNILKDSVRLVACSLPPFLSEGPAAHERAILEETFQLFTFGFIRLVEGV